MRSPLRLALCALVALTSCRTTTVATQNLDVVLSSTDNFRYRGATTDRWRDLLDAGLDAMRAVVSASNKPAEERNIPDPTDFALENLADLAASEQGGASWRHNEQVRVLARFAVHAPSVLCRERAVRELVVHAERLGLQEPFVPAASPATPAQLIEAVDGLLDALRGVSGRRIDDTTRADLEAAIGLVEELEVDVRGGARVLRALGPFLGGRLLPSDLRDRVRALSERVQARMVGEALHAAVRDRSEVVRAAGMSACIAVYGDAFLVEALFSLAALPGMPDWVEWEFRGHRLPAQPANTDDVHVAVAAAFEERGLPLAARRETARGVELRGLIALHLLMVATSDTRYTTHASQSAMRALSVLSGGELSTFRPEAWEAWWEEAAAELERQMQALEDE